VVRSGVLPLLVACGLSLAFCGGSASAETLPDRSDALGALAGLASSPQTSGISYSNDIAAVDFVTARVQAGLAADADLFAPAGTPDGPEGALELLARDGLPIVLSPFGKVAEMKALDGAKITASARTLPFFGEPGTMVIATSQRYPAIEHRLRAAGMKKRGGILEGGAQGDPSYFPYIADAGGGLVVLSDQRDAAHAARNGSLSSRLPPPRNAASIAKKLPNRSPFLGVVAHHSGCVKAVIASQNVDPLSGRIDLLGSIPRGNVGIEDQFTSEYRVAGPTRHGRRVEVGFNPRHGFRGYATAFTQLLDKGSAIRFSC
jgi:hypothetical protein